MVGPRLEQYRDRTNLKLRWREGEKVSCVMFRASDAVVDNKMVYFSYDWSNKLYAYHIPSSSWSPVPDCPHKGFALAVIDGLLTAVGE